MSQIPSRIRALTLSAVCAAALLAAAGTAQATLTGFTNKATFLSATTATATDTFNDVTDPYLLWPVDRSAGAYSYRLTDVSDFYVIDAGGGDKWLSVFNYADSIVISNFSANVRAVGGYFFNVNDSDAVVAATVTVTATDADGSVFRVSGGSATSFAGFVSNKPLSSVVISTTGSVYPTMNDLVFGAAAPVPEPAAWLLMAGGIAALVLRRRAA